MVKPGLAWPRRSDTTLIGVPAAMRSVVWVWRRSWNLMGGVRCVALAVEQLAEAFGVQRLAALLVKIEQVRSVGWPSCFWRRRQVARMASVSVSRRCIVGWSET